MAKKPFGGKPSSASQVKKLAAATATKAVAKSEKKEAAREKKMDKC
jgi:hypothetical protein